VLGADPARVVLDVLQDKGNSEGDNEEWDHDARTGERLVPTGGSGLPEPLHRVARRRLLDWCRCSAHARSANGCPNSPCGRTRRTAIKMRNTNVSWNWVLMKPPARLSRTPSSKPPIMAPRIFPMPPMTAAVKALIPSR